MQETPFQSTAKAGTTVPPSVAQLAGRFQEQAAVKEVSLLGGWRKGKPRAVLVDLVMPKLGRGGGEESL